MTRSKILVVLSFILTATGYMLLTVRFDTFKFGALTLVSSGILLLLVEPLGKSYQEDPFKVFIDRRPFGWFERTFVLIALLSPLLVMLIQGGSLDSRSEDGEGVEWASEEGEVVQIYQFFGKQALSIRTETMAGDVTNHWIEGSFQGKRIDRGQRVEIEYSQAVESWRLQGWEPWSPNRIFIFFPLTTLTLVLWLIARYAVCRKSV